LPNIAGTTNSDVREARQQIYRLVGDAEEIFDSSEIATRTELERAFRRNAKSAALTQLLQNLIEFEFANDIE
jgi:hypothetical protein